MNKFHKDILPIFLLTTIFSFMSSCKKDEINSTQDIKNIKFLSLVENAIIISDPVKEKMAHCSILYSDRYINDGTMWFCYLCDETTSVENPVNLTTYPVLCKFNVKNPYAVERWTIAKANTTISNIKLGNFPPWDPNIFINENNIQIYFQSLIEGTKMMVCRTFDKNALEIKDELQILKIRYFVGNQEKIVNFDAYGISKCAIELGFDNISGTDYIMFVSRFIRYGDYIYGALGTYNVFNGFILRTKDGIIWDLVTIQPNDIRIMEAQIEISDDIIYYIARSNLGGCYLGKYTMKNNQWSDVSLIPESLAARPELFLYREKLYGMYNLDRPLDSGWGLVPRTCMTIQEIDPMTLKMTEKITIQYKYGIHYFSVTEYNDKLYMSFTEDRRKLSLFATDIAFTEIFVD